MSYDKRKIQEEVEKVIIYAKKYDKIDIDCTDLINTWERNKKRFIELFNGKLIWQYPKKIDITLTEADKDKFFKRYLSELESYTANYDFINYVESNQKEFYNNIVTNPLDVEKVRRGDKLSKSFKHFNLENLRKIQDLTSVYQQKEHFSGYFCISVHPLDFLTISENNSGWKSCHTLDGEFASGNLSYMSDETTFVCYLKSAEDEQLKVFPEGMLWNNKKWRMIAHLNENENCIWYGRQYPLHSEQLLKLVVSEDSPFDFYQEPYKVGFNKVLIDSKKTYVQDHCVVFNNKMYQTSNFVIDVGDGLHFNDILFSSTYEPYISTRKQKYVDYSAANKFRDEREIIKSLFSVHVGSFVSTLCECGNYLDNPKEFICEDCLDEQNYPAKYCSLCGTRLYHDEEIHYDNDGFPICIDCANWLKTHSI